MRGFLVSITSNDSEQASEHARIEFTDLTFSTVLFMLYSTFPPLPRQLDDAGGGQADISMHLTLSWTHELKV